jgi:hypothetical protein
MRELTMNEFGFVSGGNVAPPPPSNQSTGSRAGGFQVGYDFRATQTIFACQAPSDTSVGPPISGLFDGTNLGSVTNPNGQGLPQPTPEASVCSSGAPTALRPTSALSVLFGLLSFSRPAC